MRALATLMLLALMLAGCTGNGGTDTTGPQSCPPGERLEPAGTNAGEAASRETTNQSTRCVPLRQPSVTLAGEPSTVRVYRAATFSWSLDPGDFKDGSHSMLTSLRVSGISQADTAAISGRDAYGVEAGKQEHVMLPATVEVQHTFDTPGTYYVRAYAEIQSTGVMPRDFWSDEVTVTVTDVLPTGNNTVVVHGVGPVGVGAGTLDPSTVSLQLGDGIVLQNDDVVDHTFTPKSCAQFVDPVVVPKGTSSAPLVFKAPGTCRFETDDVQKQTLTVNVAAQT